MLPVLAFLSSIGNWELAGIAAAVLTLAGVWLRWRSQWHHSDIEEDLKNDKISPAEAQRRMRFVEVRATLLTFGGLALLLVALVMLVV